MIRVGNRGYDPRRGTGVPVRCPDGGGAGHLRRQLEPAGPAGVGGGAHLFHQLRQNRVREEVIINIFIF